MKIRELKEQHVLESDLKKVKDHKPKLNGYIYFICDKDDEIVYIGSTVQLMPRLKVHYSNPIFNDSDIYYIECQADECREKESELIFKIQPQYNKQHRNGPRNKKTASTSSTPLIDSPEIILLGKKIAKNIRKMKVRDISKETGIHPQTILNMTKKNKRGIREKSLKNWSIVCNYLGITMSENLKQGIKGIK